MVRFIGQTSDVHLFLLELCLVLLTDLLVVDILLAFPVFALHTHRPAFVQIERAKSLAEIILWPLICKITLISLICNNLSQIYFL